MLLYCPCRKAHDMHSWIKVAIWSHPDIVTHLYQTEIKSVLVCCSVFDILFLRSKDCSPSARFLNTSQCFAMFVKCWGNICVSSQRLRVSVWHDHRNVKCADVMLFGRGYDQANVNARAYFENQISHASTKQRVWAKDKLHVADRLIMVLLTKEF